MSTELIEDGHGTTGVFYKGGKVSYDSVRVGEMKVH